jgi:hypothetical protein
MNNNIGFVYMQDYVVEFSFFRFLALHFFLLAV